MSEKINYLAVRNRDRAGNRLLAPFTSTWSRAVQTLTAHPRAYGTLAAAALGAGLSLAPVPPAMAAGTPKAPVNRRSDSALAPPADARPDARRPADAPAPAQPPAGQAPVAQSPAGQAPAAREPGGQAPAAQPPVVADPGVPVGRPAAAPAPPAAETTVRPPATDSGAGYLPPWQPTSPADPKSPDRLPLGQPDPAARTPNFDQGYSQGTDVTYASRTPAADVPARDRVVFVNPADPSHSTIIEPDGTRADGVVPPQRTFSNQMVQLCVVRYCGGVTYAEDQDGGSSLTLAGGAAFNPQGPLPSIGRTAVYTYDPPSDRFDFGFKGGLILGAPTYKAGGGAIVTISGRDLLAGEPTIKGSTAVVVGNFGVDRRTFEYKYDENGFHRVDVAPQGGGAAQENGASGESVDNSGAGSGEGAAKGPTLMPDYLLLANNNRGTAMGYVTVPLSKTREWVEEGDHPTAPGGQSGPRPAPDAQADPSSADGLIPDDAKDHSPTTISPSPDNTAPQQPAPTALASPGDGQGPAGAAAAAPSADEQAPQPAAAPSVDGPQANSGNDLSVDPALMGLPLDPTPPSGDPFNQGPNQGGGSAPGPMVGGDAPASVADGTTDLTAGGDYTYASEPANTQVATGTDSTVYAGDPIGPIA